MGCLENLFELPELYLFQVFILPSIYFLNYWDYLFDLRLRLCFENVAIIKHILQQQFIGITMIVEVTNVVLLVQTMQLRKLFFSSLVELALDWVIVIRVKDAM